MTRVRSGIDPGIETTCSLTAVRANGVVDWRFLEQSLVSTVDPLVNPGGHGA
jgi:hypothetical protein